MGELNEKKRLMCSLASFSKGQKLLHEAAIYGQGLAQYALAIII